MPKKNNETLIVGLAAIGLGAGALYFMSGTTACRVKAKLMTQIVDILRSPTTVDSLVRAALRRGETATDLAGKSDTHGNSWECWKFNDGSKLTFSHDGTIGYGMAASPSDISYSDSGAGKYTKTIVSESLKLF